MQKKKKKKKKKKKFKKNARVLLWGGLVGSMEVLTEI